MRRTNQSDLELLNKFCTDFFLRNGIHCVETIYQMDHIAVDALTLIEDIGKIIGYVDTDE
mgnify:FL=1